MFEVRVRRKGLSYNFTIIIITQIYIYLLLVKINFTKERNRVIYVNE